MPDSTATLTFKDRDQWRTWLEANHASQTEAWLVLYKANYRDLGLSLDEAVEEALCFGWIDGTLKSLDEKRYTLRFSPRGKQSIWSLNNIRRVEKLVSQGKMTEAGIIKVSEAKENGEWEAAIRREQVDVIPEALEAELRKIEGGLNAYQTLPVSRKKTYIYWLQTAKRESTIRNRIQKIINEILGR